MSKRFKFGLFNLFNSCRSKNKLPSQPRKRVPSPEKDGIWHEDMDSLIRARPRRKQRRKRSVLSQKSWEEEEGAPARLSAVFQRMMTCSAVDVDVEGKVRESFAVVKRSDDPYEDFRRSMEEMIVEKEMVEEADLRELLRCFLSLNSDKHHGIIIAAFKDISNAFFSIHNSTS